MGSRGDCAFPYLFDIPFVLAISAWEAVRVLGVDVLAAAAVGYLVRKARRVGRRADDAIDEALDAGTDRVVELVERWVEGDPAVELLESQAEAGAESERTLRRATDAVAERLEANPQFARELDALVTELARTPGGISVSAASGGVAVAGTLNITADRGGTAAGVIGSQNASPSQPGRDQA
jgi:hypothetical protein